MPLIKTVSFFTERDIKDSDYTDIVACLQYEFLKEGSTVFEYGECSVILNDVDSLGDKFYIILNGMVSVLVPNKKVKDFNSKFEEFKRLKD